MSTKDLQQYLLSLGQVPADRRFFCPNCNLVNKLQRPDQKQVTCSGCEFLVKDEEGVMKHSRNQQ